MYQYIARRILVFIPMLIALSIIVFGLAKAAPGDPFTGRTLDPNVDPEVYEKQREELGLNKSIPEQYINWLSEFAKGNFGKSMIFKGRTVKSLIIERFSNTLNLGIFALTITLIVSIPIGIFSAKKPYSLLDYSATTFGFLGLAIPNFFFGLIAIYFLSIKLGWFPAQGTISGRGITGFEAIIDRFHHIVLLGITLGLAG